MSDATNMPVVSLRGVRLDAVAPYDCGLIADGFSISAGEFAVVEIENEIHRAPLADVVSGLLIADEGDAKFENEDWRSLSPNYASRARGRIGRVFDSPGSRWISNLDIDENVTLAMRFHSGSVSEDSQKRLEELSRIAGCWPLPEGRPSSAAKNILRRTEWVRAFVAVPSLVILERPLLQTSGNSARQIAELIGAALQRGAAILWVAAEGEPWQDALPQATTKWRLVDGRLAAVEMK